MFVLLGVLPYFFSIAFYWLNARDLFREAHGQLPSTATWRLTTPVLIGGGLTPLALADVAGSQRGLLLSATAVALVFTLAVVTLLQFPGRFRALYRPVASQRYEIRPLLGRRVLVAIGALVIAYGAAVNIIASRADRGAVSIAPANRSLSAPR